MYYINNKNLAVTKEVQMTLSRSDLYQYDVPYNRNFSSEPFEIILGEQKTKWKIVLGLECENLRASLQKLESTSNDFSINFVMYTHPKRNIQTISMHYENPYFQDRHTFHVMNTKCSFLGKSQCDNLLLVFKIELVEKVNEENCYPADLRSILSNFENLHNSKVFSDFTFLCSDGKTIPVHRSVLAASSEVMKIMFEIPMRESESKVAEFKDIDGNTMMELLRYIYTGQVFDLAIYAPKLLDCGEKYELGGLKSLCAKSMAQNLSKENVLEYFRMAGFYKEKTLLKRCALFIKSNFKKISQHPDWEDLDIYHKSLIELLVESSYDGMQQLRCL